jgi:hypothetical protein
VNGLTARCQRLTGGNQKSGARSLPGERDTSTRAPHLDRASRSRPATRAIHGEGDSRSDHKTAPFLFRAQPYEVRIFEREKAPAGKLLPPPLRADV